MAGGRRTGPAGRRRATQSQRGLLVRAGRLLARAWKMLTRRLPTSLRRVALGILAASFLVGFVSAAYVASLDRRVRERFEGVRFRLPSRVYSAPTILYPGLDWKLVDLRGSFERLGYRAASETRDLPPGQYVWGENRVRVHLRAFEHPSRPEPSRDVVLRLRGSSIAQIRAMPDGTELGAILLEPEELGAYYGPNRQQRELVRLDELPRHLLDAVLAVEDQRFESHGGIDLRRIAGAMLANLRAGSIRQGGSTLTQQLVKNFFLTPERTYRRKLQEALMALLVEARYDKPAILESYLNEIYLGQRGATQIHGVGEAARLYFGKSASRLSVAESGLLAAIIQSPNGTSPYRDPERATRRRDLVLELMFDQRRIDAASYEKARQEPLRLASITPEQGDTRYFLDLLHRQLADHYPSEVLTVEGLHIYSTLDHRLQSLAAMSLSEGIAALERRFPALRSDDPARALQGCLVALRPQTGELLALVGGRDYRVSQFDRCTQARRQPGSVFKPFVYIAALEPVDGGPLVTLSSFLDDSPLEIDSRNGPWAPKNHDDRFHESVTVREALENSYNVATARLAQEIGIKRVVRVAQRLGIESRLPAVPSLALGTAEVTPLEIARAYATLASGGIRPEIESIEDVVDRSGAVLERRRLQFERVLDAGTAYLATNLLEGVAERGTAASVRAGGLRGPIAAKTGTTDEERDLWFVGFTPDLVAVVWLGFDEPRSVGLSGSGGALPIWRRFVEGATGGVIRGAFLRPPDVQRVAIEPSTGALALAGCPERREEYFLRGTLPTHVCPDGARPGDRGDGVPRRFLRWLGDRL
ncbi:MAG: PBP1A family penicillin-binding protein [Myxococcales bacterium]|nr:PBP1A family penicillin-binding protein [Myxococcales bacterium]MDH5305881.1 PBP1A family penicillin-binding protein [Myxococcales bacterium]MDH5565341.1 PBP1A family penicillin-binding protein [Myxococcales bacterium]